MAIIYPKSIEYISENAPFSEREVFKCLQQLSDSFYVFHSVQWKKRSLSKTFSWFENDFLILTKKSGIIVLEVKGGHIYFKDGLFHQINSETNEDVTLNEGNDPLSQAKRGMFHFKKVLDKHIKGISNRISIVPAIWLSSSDLSKSGQLPLDYEENKQAILDCNSLKNPQESIARIYDYYESNELTNITDEEFEKIKTILAPEFELIPSPSIVKDELDNSFLRLTNEQATLLDYLEEQRVATIQGAAGTGKTLIALEAARRFSKDDKKVLFLCFNRFLFEHLKKDCPIQNVDYFNINTFVKQFSKLDISSSSIRSRELQKYDISKFSYQAVIIDEAQDFENEEIVFFSDLCEINNSYFYVFYDKNQVINSKKVPEWIERSDCRLVLHKNCRNTYEIACTSYNVIDLPVNSKFASIKGVQPSIIFTHKNDLVTLGLLIKHFKNDENGYKDSDITILSLVNEEHSILNDVSVIDGIRISRERNNSNVFYTSTKKFKGLESKVVIVIDINKDSFSDPESKKVFYVACSRAMHRLALYVSATEDEISSIGRQISDLSFSPKGNIVSKTRTAILKI